MTVTMPQPGVVVVTATGEIDLSTQGTWSACLVDALDPPPPAVLVADLSEVAFFSCAGVTTLMRVEAKAERAHADFRVVGGHRPVRRPLEIVGLTEHLHLFDTRAAALAA
ncbi:STAS domain-containing protein [Amycolatopsis anabasis]|uniref:STAS domain-containing protein n=1 Tax=Amycolatopsis anabasis TaxID=1840409 RepID=UPI00131B56F4|nr:STAS domain-containing protein [Amycolatopsis anabasis]